MIEINLKKELIIVKTFHIVDYGARFCDELQTEAIQSAIDDCFLAGGGRVVVPCGIFLTGDLRLRSGVELYLEAGAILKGSRNPEDYFHYLEDKLEPVDIEELCSVSSNGGTRPGYTVRWYNGLIRAFHAENIAIIGERGSYIDGSNCYDAQGENDFRGPHGMSLMFCKNIRLEGYIFIHSGNWAHAIFHSQNIAVKNVSVYAGHDGVDVRTCDDVLIEDCTFNTGDDCVAGFDNHDVIVRNCLLNSSCMPIRFGGNNVLFENCRADRRNAFGFRMYLDLEEKVHGHITDGRARHDGKSPFSYYCDFRAVIRKTPGNIVFRNCHFEKEHELIRLEYTGRNRWCVNRSLESITFEDCTIKGLTRAGMLWGDEKEKVTCRFKNVKISCEEGSEKAILLAAGNFEKIVFEDCTIEGFENPTILAGTEGKIEVIRTTPVTIQKSNLEECIDAHPGGYAFQDRHKFAPKAKNL